MEKIIKAVKSQDNKYVSFIQVKGNRLIACIDFKKLKDFVNNDIQDVESFRNEANR